VLTVTKSTTVAEIADCTALEISIG